MPANVSVRLVSKTLGQSANTTARVKGHPKFPSTFRGWRCAGGKGGVPMIDDGAGPMLWW